MSRDKGQVFIFNDAELSLIKNVFSENEELLYLVRKVLLQFEMTKEEKKIIKQAIVPEVYAVLKKRIHPETSNDFPFGQLMDINQTLTQDLKSKNVVDMKPLIDAKKLEIAYLNQQFKVLKDIDGKHKEEIKLSDWANLDGKSNYDAYVQTTARNFLLGFIDPMLLIIKNIGGQKTETVEEAKKRMDRNSAK